MTRGDALAILKILKMSYPGFYKELDNVKDANEIVDFWSIIFANDSEITVKEAVKSLICTTKYPPTIADIKEKIALITQPEQQSEFEAWNMVYKAINNATRTNYDGEYLTKSYFDNFPDVIQKIVGSPNQLRDWAMMDPETVSSVIQSNFMRSYKAKLAYQKQIQSLSESTKAMITGLSENFKMIKE